MSLVCFGEALIDFLSDGKQPESFTKYAGGAPANVAVAAAKLGLNTSFCGMLGDDMFGHFIKDELDQHSVNTSYCRFTDAAKTALAFVSLDESGERSFSFYRPPAADLLYSVDDFDHAMFANHAIMHVCSNSLTEHNIYQTTIYGLTQAKKAGAICSFDMNLRENLWPSMRHTLDRMWHVISLADIVKLSFEELEFLNQKSHQEMPLEHTIDAILKAGVTCLLVTNGGEAISFYHADFKGQVSPPATKVVDTTAAGDAFIGGMLSKIGQHCENKQSFKAFCQTPANIEQTIAYAAKAGAFAVSRYGAFASLPSAADLA
ncbi:carbohydrate kinase [Pseudoalteromonas sp. OFAV1]|jgi:fructokinase|uniref:carbohydrate kinase family protein n=1 Tax=Pseudoalteromonas sp. OFAV1 TaxID=2908892 RepID=UPI000C685E60|nr:carbohydrate kinase [Pseudoalteromonas sp. OFAV1]MBD57538.1 fructokinase [Pseudoalteromonas sp.]MCF2902592.1 carbohydrate kinase [Pseudoalteromonas sp. OFAV1]|tara:strand:+ start:215 stop:1168 length:954 start_codon:yes stop_codon:yes gene_type:complete